MLDEKEKLIFDPLTIDPEGLSAISGIDYTMDGSRAAVGVQTKGAERNPISFVRQTIVAHLVLLAILSSFRL